MTDDATDDGVPSASPEIQAAYEAAVGQFVLAFNSIDNLLTDLIITVLRKLDLERLADACTKRTFYDKVLVIDLLKVSVQGNGIANVPVDLLKDIACKRNFLVHGHFDQNPFDGS
jgi:hypothetical protein